MSELNVIGKIKFMNLTAGNERYEKSEVVVTTDEQYPQDILVEFGGAKAGLPDQFKVGDLVNISVNLRGREWVNPEGVSKYFNSIVGWKISKRHEETPVAQPYVTQPSLPQNLATNEEEADDLPF